MADTQTILRRLRNLVNDRPYGYSVSGPGFATDITALSSPSFNISFGSAAPVTISLGLAALLDNGAAIAVSMQEALRGHATLDADFLLAKVTFNSTTGYTIQSGDIGTESAIAITPGPTDNITDLLQLGMLFNGSEYLSPAARFDDARLVEVLNFALATWNATVAPYMRVCSLESAPEQVLTILLYYAWRMLLEQDAGSTVYSFRQKLGGDELALTDIHKNILDLLRYLNDRLDDLLADVGVGNIIVSNLTRYDRERDMRVPTYENTRMDHPRFLQLVRESANSVLIEWQESRIQDFAIASVWYATPAVSPMVDKALLTSPNEHRPNAIKLAAVKGRETSNPIHTVARISNLASQVWHFVIVFQDTRGDYYWSDEYSLDLTDAAAVPVLVARNNNTGRDPNIPC